MKSLSGGRAKIPVRDNIVFGSCRDVTEVSLRGLESLASLGSASSSGSLVRDYLGWSGNRLG